MNKKITEIFAEREAERARAAQQISQRADGARAANHRYDNSFHNRAIFYYSMQVQQLRLDLLSGFGVFAMGRQTIR